MIFLQNDSKVEEAEVKAVKKVEDKSQILKTNSICFKPTDIYKINYCMSYSYQASTK